LVEGHALVDQVLAMVHLNRYIQAQ
jgi:hypothetical protein